jgi:hypothetical protein
MVVQKLKSYSHPRARRRGWAWKLAAVGACLVVVGGLAAADPAQAGTGGEQAQAWQPLFDGKTLANWQATKFTGEAA